MGLVKAQKARASTSLSGKKGMIYFICLRYQNIMSLTCNGLLGTRQHSEFIILSAFEEIRRI